ncbi:hypothetical protein C6497_14640 [Candidatus Poribacteria bacterium]|nr:MAG: hypothetical protein C6497_14640 [Candidatus Poribacteria bacterium]
MNEDTIISSNISRLTNPPNHHFFGYYGINPWDSNGEYHLALETDFHTYPRGTERYTELMLYNITENRKVFLGKFQQDKQFTGDIRCDLHPRWSTDGKTITFDSIHENTRQIYCIDL